MQWLFLVFVAGCAVMVMWDRLQRRKKLLLQLKSSFGHTPTRLRRCTGANAFWQHVCKALPAGQIVDDITWNDLDGDTLFDRANACLTTAGQHILYAMLRQPVPEADLLQRTALAALFDHDALRLETQLCLCSLGVCLGTNTPTLLFHPEACNFSRLRQAKLGIGALLASLCLLPFLPAVGLLGVLCAAVHNLWLFTEAQKQLFGQLESLGYFLRTVQVARKLVPLLRPHAPEFSALLESALRSAPKSGKSIAALVTGVKSDAEAMAMAFGGLTLLPLLQFSKILKVIVANQNACISVYRLVGELDAAIAVQSLRRSLPTLCTPTFLPQNKPLFLETKGLIHPLLESAIPNGAQLTKGWLLTGSNASGKSTFIKAVACNCILAQTLHLCTAQRFALTPAGIVTSMAIQDALLDGDSYFVAEVKSLHRVVRLAEQNSPCYCFIDEILRGTNTAERIAAACAVLRFLARPTCLCLAATHDGELGELLSTLYQNMHFSEQITPKGISFDFLLKEGICTTRNALHLLEHYSFPAEIVNEAKELAGSGA